MRRRPLWLVLLCAGGGGGGCGVNNPTYYPPPMGAIETGANDAGAEIAAVVTLPFRPPTDVESARLDEHSEALGFREPWLRRDQVAISVQYSITNLDDRRGTAQVFVDGANEFTAYDRAALQAAAQMAVMNNDEVVVLPLIQTKPIEVAPGQTQSGVVREDDFAEAELDLDAIGRWMAPPPAVLINASEVNGTGLEQLPANVVIPALFRVGVTLVAERHMRLDFLVRVRDDKNRLLESARASEAFAPSATDYTPPPPPMP
jgi:hypothetical protein